MTPRAPIDTARLWSRLMRLAEIGALPGGGVDRQALTAGEAKAWALMLDWAREGGLQPSVDPIGNLFLTLPGQNRNLKPILAGSHLDTQRRQGPRHAHRNRRRRRACPRRRRGRDTCRRSA